MFPEILTFTKNKSYLIKTENFSIQSVELISVNWSSKDFMSLVLFFLPIHTEEIMNVFKTSLGCYSDVIFLSLLQQPRVNILFIAYNR